MKINEILARFKLLPYLCGVNQTQSKTIKKYIVMKTISFTSEQLAEVMVKYYNSIIKRFDIDSMRVMLKMCQASFGLDEGEAFFNEALELAKQKVNK